MKGFRYYYIPFLLLLCIAIQPTDLCATAIESAASGNWNQSATWVGGNVPVAGDDVVIKNGHNITLSDARACATLTIEPSASLAFSGTLTNSGNLLNQGTLNWSNGTFDGAGSMTNDGTMNITGFTTHNTSANIVNNAGKTINWSDGHLDQAAGGQTLTNHGTFNLPSNPSGIFCQMAVVNTGTIAKPAGASALQIVQPFDNQTTGAVTVAAGATLQFNTGGNLTQSGNFSVAGTLVFSSGSHNFLVSTGFGGSGTLNISGACTVTATAGFYPAFATVNHISLLSAGTGTALTIPSGTTWNWSNGDFGTFTSITNDGTMNITGFANHNTGASIVNNAGKAINWSDGHLDQAGGGQTLTNNGTFNLPSNPSGIFCQMAVVNTGAIAKPAGASALQIVQPFDNQTTGAVTVAAGATLQFNTGGNLTQSGNFSVAGTVVFSSGSHNFLVSTGFGGSGTLNISGVSTVTATAGFYPAFATVNHISLLNAGAGTSLTIPSGTTWNWSNGDFGAFTSITNDGTLNITGFTNHNTGASIVNNAGKTINWSDGHLDQAAGGQTLTNHGTFNLPSNPAGIFCQMAVVNTGTITKPAGASALQIVQPFDNQTTGAVTVAAGATLQFNTGGNLTQSGNFSVAGTVVFSSGSHNFLVSSGFGGSGTLNISGACTVTATAGFYPAFATVNHISLLSAGTGTALTIPSGTTWNWSNGDFGTFTSITNDGTMNVTGFTNHNTGASIVNNAGKAINWSDGHLDQAGGGQTLTNYGTFNLIANASGLQCLLSIVNYGTVNKPANASTLTLSQPFDNQPGGSIQGQSTISFASTFSNTGLIAPGASPGILKLNRNAGVPVHHLAIEVASNAGAGTGHDQFQSANAVSMSGDLSVNLINGFTPSYGAVFTIMTYASRTGNFSNVIPDCWTVNYGPTGTTITYEPDTWYADADGDGFGDLNITTQACIPPNGYVQNSTDCNDVNAAVYPGAPETCNGIDDDCDGLIDDADPGVTGRPTWYADADGDSYGNPAVQQYSCLQPPGYVANNIDCDDANASIHPGATELCNGLDDDCDGLTDEGVQLIFYADIDGDAFGDLNNSTLACTAPTGYVADNTDCDDANASIYPGAPEICNGLDDDCDGLTDEGVQSTFYADADGDGFGNPTSSTFACVAPQGYVSDNTDCDDTDPAIHPGATEICNNADDNCDGQVDEGVQQTYYADADGDGYGNLSSTILACSAPSGYVSDHTDCNDSNGSIHPGALELCNGLDDNCDGQLDEGVGTIWYADADGDDYGDPTVTVVACSAPLGYIGNNTDCDDHNADINPGATETCNGIDDDCDGQTDEGIQSVFYQDADGDGFGDENNSLMACFAPSGYVNDDTDCNDGDPAIYPGAIEVCNGIDDNCNGQVDEGVQQMFYADADSDGFGDSNNPVLACFAPSGFVPLNTDCDDNNANIHPEAIEICNGLDDNCNGLVDEGNVCDGDGDGYTVAQGDCDDANAAIHPGAIEICNNLDDDCDGHVDENVGATWYADTDEDGYGNAQATQISCVQPLGYVANDADCDDTDDTVHPGATEVCNNKDDDCDGLVDETTLALTLSSGNILCAGGITALIATATGGATPYQFSLNGGGFGPGNTFTVSAGSHTVVVLDAHGCMVSQVLTVAEPDPILIDPVVVTNVACNGGNTGAIDISLQGGTPNFTYRWSNNKVTQDILNLAAGTYTVTVTDAHGCTATVSAVVNPRLKLVVSKTNVTCYGGNDGTATATVSGGTPGYNYLWNTGATTPIITNLVAGTYRVTISDDLGCTRVSSIGVGQAALIGISGIVQHVTCNGYENGTIAISISHGVAPFTYAWSDGETTEDRTDLGPGTYTLLVTDVNGCTRERSFTITQTAMLTLSFSIKNVTCNGDENGEITATVAGGKKFPTTGLCNGERYCFNWSNGATTRTISNLAPGAYELSVTDANGCLITGSVNITQPDTLFVTSVMQEQLPNGKYKLTVNAHGGTTPYKYKRLPGTSYQSSNIFTNVPVGTYQMIVRDVRLCEDTLLVQVPETGSRASHGDRDQWFEHGSLAEPTGTISAKISPNPALDMFRITLDAPSASGAIHIFNISGNLIVEQEMTLGIGQYQFSLTGWAPGIYFVQIQTEKGKETHRLVVGMR